MKQNLAIILDATAILSRLFLASICYKVSPEITIVMIAFFVAHVAVGMYFTYLEKQEHEKIYKAISSAIDKAVDEYEQSDNKTE